MDLCHLNLLQCFNNGTCTINYSSNITYCLCDQCYKGNFCKNALPTYYFYFDNIVVGGKTQIASINN